MLPLLLLLQGPQAQKPQTATVDSAALRHSNGLVPPMAMAVRVSTAPVMDGTVDDPIWATATPITDFRQVDPHEGQPASERTEVRVLYDDQAVYIGVRLWDDSASRIAHHLGRRDTFTQSDDFRVLIDSYHDHRTAFRFDITPTGVKGDIQFGDDGNFSDQSWDPVWEAKTSIDSLGWSAEERIPFSQLRFSRAPDQIWGIRFVRTILRKNEFDLFPFVGKTENGFVSRFAHLGGLHNIPAPRRLELLPYTSGTGTFQPAGPVGNPFSRTSAYSGNAGLDVKYGVNSFLTLDATINPDFGQVELDPAFVNLTAFQVFLPEHRPFFVEGDDIFNFGGGSGGLAAFGSTPQFFYSRRIGRAPEGSTYSAGQFTDYPDNTAILGAAKLTGKTPSGWSVGLLDAVTSREEASVLDTNTAITSHDIVEPASNFLVGRVRRTLNGGGSSYGAIVSAVNRDITVPALRGMTTGAYTFGVDTKQLWDHNTYALAADLGGSYLTGDTAALQAAQFSSGRYYQRPDAHAFHYDPTRTSLAGFNGNVYLDKLSGAWLWGTAVSTSSPGFEVNDLGFQQRVDRISGYAYLARHQTTPGRIFRETWSVLTVGPSWNYDGNPIQRAVTGSVFGNFNNFWFFQVIGNYNAQAVDDRLTRGGPLALAPANWYGSAMLQSDQRKALTGMFMSSYTKDVAGGWQFNVSQQVGWRPTSALNFSVTPNFTVGPTAAQYVQTVPDTFATGTFKSRYVFAQLFQHEFDVTVRVNAAVSPALSLEVFAQPFAFTGAYGGFKELAQPGTFNFNRYQPGTGITYAAGTYTVKPDPAQPTDSFFIANPDFRTRSVRINAVLRWEYRPGSTLFLVWTQSRGGTFADPTFDIGRDFNHQLFLDRPTNVLLIKLNYWMSL
ncbi:MAG TPA: DUF5916 domain-containing protein [Gemmatimonadales bacterium]|nr:DUF5916 domain-containing protein [Gemmatimonadales bacterium]